MEHELDKNESISALADGQLAGEAFARAVEAACADRQALATWHAYHVVGEVLRSGAGAAGGTPAPVFLDKLSKRLAQEPMALATAAEPMPAIRVREAANDGVFRWKLVAGLASVAAIAAVGWSVLGTGSVAPTQPQLAAAPAQPQAQALAAAPSASTVLARTNNGAVMIRDSRLDEMMAAHRQFGGASALQMPAGFLRNATFEQPAR